MEKKSSFLVESFRRNIRQYTMILALLGIWILFFLLTQGTFLTPRNLSNLFLQTATVAIVAIGMVLIIVTNNIDLSIGSFAAFTGAIAAVLQVKYGWSAVPTILVTIMVGFLIGAFHGFWIAKQKVPAFIVTLATMLVLRGGVLGVTGGATISGLTPGLKAIGQDYLPSIFSTNPKFNDTTMYVAGIAIIALIIMTFRQRAKRQHYGFTVLPMGLELLKILGLSVVIAIIASIMVFNAGIPYCVLLLAALTIIINFIATKTTFGRHLYAIGGNIEAAKLSGIDTTKHLLWMFVFFGGLTSIGGMVMTARLDAATAQAGNAMELDVIAATVIGGTSFLGGEGTIFGAIVGALVMASLDNGMSLMNLDITYQYVVKGLILLLAVWVDISTRNKR
ncbi:MAG: sugar ABC transporter permease [Spartobacteria bacterium]|nr:sugar ABC transporter permease [Spartobacteria bacterium]